MIRIVKSRIVKSGIVKSMINKRVKGSGTIRSRMVKNGRALLFLSFALALVATGAAAISSSRAMLALPASQCGGAGFVAAIRAGDVAAVRCHLDAGARAGARIEDDPDRSTLLMAASLAGKPDVASLLIERGADPSERSLRGRTALMWAAWSGQADTLHLLIGRAERASPGSIPHLVNARDADGRTAIMFASMAGRREAAALLIERGADLNATDKNGFSALAYATNPDLISDLLASGAALGASSVSPAALAVARRCHGCLEALIGGAKRSQDAEEIVRGAMRWIVDLGEHRALEILAHERPLQVREVVGEQGEQFLHRAVTAGDARLAGRLIDLGAEIDARRERDGATPLMVAASRGDVALVNLLLERGAEADALDKEGESALLEAARKGHRQVVRALLASGASADVNDRFGLTSLMMAARSGDVEMIRDLLAAGADPSLVDLHEQTALVAAIRAGEMPAFLALLDAAGGAHWRDRQGLTPLMIAAETGQMEMVRALTQAGADTQLRDNYGLTAAERARRAGHDGIESMLGGAR